MKSSQIKLSIIVMLFGIQWLIGQNQTNDTIWWKDQPNTYSLLSEITTVTIKLNNGSQIKDVSLRNLDCNSSKIEYKGQGVLHDVYISEIKMIVPGKHYYQVMEFDKDNKPSLKIANQIDPLKDYSKFPKHTLPQQKSDAPILSPSINTSSLANTTTINHTTKPADTLILNNGKIILIHIQSLEGRNLRYKRVDVPDGPIYNVNTGSAVIKQYKLNYTIDYSNNK